MQILLNGCRIFLLLLALRVKWHIREQGWRSGNQCGVAGFDSGPVHIWRELLLILALLQGFFPGFSGFPPTTKKYFKFQCD